MTHPSQSPSASHNQSELAARPGKYLTITLGRESYGIPVLKVREIIRICPITRVANMPPQVRGVINLRGKVIPVVDLRTRFGLPAGPDHDRTCIVVTQVAASLFTDYLVAFELTSLVLLVAIVGAVLLAKKRVIL